jgi:hypothetical protein
LNVVVLVEFVVDLQLSDVVDLLFSMFQMFVSSTSLFIILVGVVVFVSSLFSVCFSLDWRRIDFVLSFLSIVRFRCCVEQSSVRDVHRSWKIHSSPTRRKRRLGNNVSQDR